MHKPTGRKKSVSEIATIVSLVAITATACGSGSGKSQASSASASPSAKQSVKLADIIPLSGPYAPNGKLMQEGAQLAVDDINTSGGLKGLGGASLHLVVQDAGGSVGEATSAAVKVLSQPGISAAMGSFLSSYTLATTEVAERDQIPWLTDSFADPVMTRGLKYVFRDGPSASQLVTFSVPVVLKAAKAAGHPITKAALVGDNTASSLSFYSTLAKTLPSSGVTVSNKSVWTPPLSDPQTVALQVKNSGAQVIFLSATAQEDYVAIARAFDAVGISAPIVGQGGQFVAPPFFQAVGASAANKRVMSVLAAGVLKGEEAIGNRFQQKYGTPMVQDAMEGYVQTYILADAINSAKSANPQDVRNALASIDITSGPGAYGPGGRVEFDSSGQNKYAGVVLQQWQNGVPVTVAPVARAVAKLEWPS